MELMVMIDACKRASARSITAVIPYYGYARADRKTHGRECVVHQLSLTMSAILPLYFYVLNFCYSTVLLYL